jgi:hypothetical protein
MSNFRRNAKVGVLIIVAVLAVSQMIRIEKTNPPVRADATIDPPVKPLLKRGCYNCHSNETVWPWYSNVAPVSWLIASDVKEGRRHLNFSEWVAYPVDVQRNKLMMIADEVGGGSMPPWYYSIMHRNSRLTTEERNRIKDWAAH